MNIRALYYFNFFNGFRPHWPIAIIYFEKVTSSFASAMTVYSIVFLTQALLEVPTGMLSDGHRRRRTMILGAVCASLSITCYAIGFSFWILACGALLEGLSRALFSGTESALLYASLPTDNRESSFRHYLGRINSMSQLGLCLSAISGSLMSLVSLEFVLWASILPQILSLVSVLALKDVRIDSDKASPFLSIFRDSIKQFRANSRLRLVAFAETIEFGFGEAIFYFQGAFFQLLIPTWALGIARCLNHFAGFIGFWFAGKAVSIVGAKNTLIGGTILSSIVRIGSVTWASSASPFIMASSNCIYGPSTAARSALLHLEFTDQQRATMDSMVSFSGSLLFALASTLLGMIADYYGPGQAMLIGLFFNSAVIPIYLAFFKRS